MIPRAALNINVIRTAVGTLQLAGHQPAAGEDLEIRLDHQPVPSLFHAFRIGADRPHRPRLLQVFPYDAPAWRAEIARLLELEVRAWQEWWRWVASDRQVDPQTRVYAIAPLLDPLECEIRRVEIHADGTLYPALLRPFLEWPDQTLSRPSDAELRRMWKLLLPICQTAWRGEPGLEAHLSRLEPSKLPLHRFLSDGRHLVVSHWRLFHPRFHRLSERLRS